MRQNRSGGGPIRAECYNRVFVSSASYQPNLGSAGAIPQRIYCAEE